MTTSVIRIMRTWNCLNCGRSGVLPPDADDDDYLCPDCGEPVFVDPD